MSLLIIDVPVEARIDRLVQDYNTTDRKELIEACRRIAQKLTRPRFLEIIDCIEKNDLRRACEYLLVYYDHYYNRGIEKRKNQEISFLSLSGFNLDDDIARVKAAVVTKYPA